MAKVQIFMKNGGRFLSIFVFHVPHLINLLFILLPHVTPSFGSHTMVLGYTPTFREHSTGKWLVRCERTDYHTV